MNSIRKKLFFQVGLLIGILIIVSIMGNTFFFKYYQDSKMRNKLTQLYGDISVMESEDYEGATLENIERMGGLDIQIFDKEKRLVYSSRNFNTKYSDIHDKGKSRKPLTPERFLPPEADIIKRVNIDDGVEIIWVDDKKMHMRSINVVGVMKNGYWINMRMPLFPVEQAVQQANIFDMYVGLLMLPIGMIFAFFLAKSFTKPILDINKKTQKLKALDFQNRCNVESNDEIGELAQSINEMSGELAETIASLNRANQELQNEIMENEELHERRRKLLNNVSHELKTPLALIQGYAEGLQVNVANDKERRDFYCHVIKDETNKMNQLIRNLLDVNQLESGEASINRSEFDISEMVSFVLQKYVHKFEEYNINGRIAARQFVYADREKMEQVFTNFLNNAIQYSDAKKKIEVDLEANEEWATLKVFNTCDAISEQELSRIWDSFYKINKSRNRELGGYGLGLSIVKEILLAHEYDFGVGQRDGGIEFWLRMNMI